MAWLWTMGDLIAAMHARPIGNLPAGISGISIDSRSISRGEAFFAIKGDRVDGHDYASVALANGASMLVVSEGKLPAMGRLVAPMLVVDDVLAAMVRLGMAARDRSRAKVIAVTGSVGKTTTKEMLRHVLSACGTVHASAASFNNHWGVPLTLARMPENVDFGVFEIGMNHPDEIRPLVKMVRPHIAIVTTVAAAHLGNFRDLDEIAAAKAEIFEGVSPGGHAIINLDNEKYPLLEAAAQAAGVAHIHGFGSDARADYRLAEYVADGATGQLWASVAGHTYEVTLGAPGRHIAENAVAALGAAHLAGANMPAVVEAMATLAPEKGRGRRHRLSVGGGTATLIDESYNANPASMRAAIALLRDTAPEGEGRRIAVLGDMLEMGVHSAEAHAALAGPLMTAGIRSIWLAGPDMAHLRDSLSGDLDVVHAETVDALLPMVVKSMRPGDVVMVKSSNGTGSGRIVAALLDKYPPIADTEAAPAGAGSVGA